ncbi:hypothetical protein WA026_018713 [Henosepilachna vigintioctopunctata]|uniref:Uncharacterized protein n=1 Tax=Henosepilachna vigintioctopunctata TaxID=420089 RepID=A0AAW1TWX4_9CUCU
MHDLAQLVNSAFVNSFTIKNIISEFAETSTWPFSRNPYFDEDSYSAFVTDRPFDTATTGLESKDTNEQKQIFLKVIIENQSITTNLSDDIANTSLPSVSSQIRKIMLFYLQRWQGRCQKQILVKISKHKIIEKELFAISPNKKTTLNWRGEVS